MAEPESFIGPEADFYVEQHNGVAIVGSNSDFELDAYTAPGYQDVLRGVVLDPENTSIVADISSCTFIDATGLNTLQAALIRCSELDKPFVIYNSGPHGRRIHYPFVITGLSKVFRMVISKQPQK